MMFDFFDSFNLVAILCFFVTLGSSLTRFSMFDIFVQSFIITETISLKKQNLMRYFYLRKLGQPSDSGGRKPVRTRSRLPRNSSLLPSLSKLERSFSCPAQKLSE